MTTDPAPPSRSAGLVGFAVLTSRILGLVREQIFAALFGASLEYDAFVTAFRIPNLLRDLFAEGALSAAFVTVFSEKLETHGDQPTWLLVNRVLHLLLLLLVLVTLVGIWFSPQIIDLIAPGFGAIPAKRDLTIVLAQWMWPFIALVFIAALMMGVLNARERYTASSFASAIFNVGAVFGGVLCAYLFAPQYITGMVKQIVFKSGGTSDLPGATQAVFGMALGTLIGGLLQIAVQSPSLYQTGFRYAPALNLQDRDLWRVMKLLLPAVLGGAATQINVFVNSNFASELGNGRVGWLNYAFRLIQFPIGVFGVAIATTALPGIARAAARHDAEDFRQRISNGLGLVFVLCIPSACGLAVLGNLIVAVIYEHGKFTGADTRETAAALVCYAIGLAGYAAIKVLAPAFYALGNAQTPMLVSLFSVVLNFGLNHLLVRKLQFGHCGLALSTAGVILTEFIVFLWLLHFQAGTRLKVHSWQALGKILAASGVLSLVAWGVVQMWTPHTFVNRAVQLSVAMVLASLAFAGCCRVLRIQEFELALDAFGGRLGLQRFFKFTQSE